MENRIKTACIFAVPCDNTFLSEDIKFYQEFFQGYPKDIASFKHVGLVLDWPLGIHSTVARGVHKVNIIEKYPNVVILQHEDLENDSALRNKIALDALKNLNKQYDLLSLFGFPFKYTISYIKSLLSIKPDNKFFCSELVAKSYRGRGVNIASQRISPEFVTPADVLADPKIRIIADFRKKD